LRPYIDTVGKLTIGWGHNIQDEGITQEEADFIFENDFAECLKELAPYVWYVDQPQHVQDALVNMCFNMGITKLLGFKKMIRALILKDYTNAAIEALDSRWAQQVGNRAKDVALMIRQG
jgi:lysozyme